MIFKNARVYQNHNFVKTDVQVKDGKIVAVGESLQGDDAIDLSGKLLLPGLIDVHSHGCVNGDFSDADPALLKKMCYWYASHGVTSVLATTMTNPVETTEQAMKNIHTVIEEQKLCSTEEAHILGINMEGPFLGKDKKGAHDEQYLTPPVWEYYQKLYALSGGAIRLTDIDPTLPGAMDFIRKVREQKLSKVSIAHTSATYQQAKEAFEAGATEVTHLFNAMNGLHHREPGIVGAVCDMPLNAELICDGFHVNPTVIRMMFRLIPEQIVLISDSMCATGMADGVYELGGLTVYVRDGKATLKDGTIAGSTVNVYQALCNVVSFGVPLEDAVRSATEIPAKAVGVDDQVGSIAVGKRADLLILEQDLAIHSVYLDGKQLTR